MNNEIALIEAKLPTPLSNFADALHALETLQKLEKEVREALTAAMLEYNVKQIDTDDLTVTLIQSADRERLDTKGLRKAHPELYDEFVEMVAVKPSVRVKLK